MAQNCSDCGASPDDLHEVGCAAIERMCQEKNIRFRAKQRYTHGWTDPRSAKPGEVIENWDPRNWRDRHGREVGAWLRDHWRGILIVIIWAWILWKLLSRT